VILWLGMFACPWLVYGPIVQASSPYEGKRLLLGECKVHQGHVSGMC